MTLAAGSRLGPYEILGAIGAGGMGEVYRAKDPRLGREVAIKVLPASFSQDADRLRRFEQEAKAAGILNHPNITAVHDIGTHEDAPYVVQELLEGETLRSVLAGGRPPQRKALEYAAQIAHGLAAAHEKGIVHRDLKPENIFVTKDGRVKILDFGLAKLTQLEGSSSLATNLPTETKGTEPGVVLGTLGYMSPEQVRGRPADARSDIFSFGAILYELLSGNRAFRGDSAADTMSAILKEDPPDLSVTNQTVSPGLERIVRHCLEKNPEQRFQSARDLAFDLETASGTSASSLAAQAPVAAGHSSTKNSARAALALAVLALPIAGYLLGKRSVPAESPAPTYRRLTFRHGQIPAARFAPDGQTIVFAAAWEGAPLELYASRLEFPDSKPIGLTNSALLAVSSQGELALIQGGEAMTHQMRVGTVSQAALSGGAPREILEDVRLADWGPGGRDLAVVHHVGSKDRLEFPVGKVVYETSGWIGWPRVSPSGDRIAFADHEAWPDDRGSVAVVDLAGRKRILSSGWEGIEGLAWRPDGREIWFTAASAGVAQDLYSIDSNGRQRLIARVPGGFVIQDVFRDGRVLLTRETESCSTRGVAPGETKERDLSWLDWSYPADLSPDGRLLLMTEQGLGAGAHYMACMRKTDGSPVVRLGEGNGAEFSPDGKWALTVVPSNPEQLFMVPTGPGEARKIERGSLVNYVGVSFFPDGKRILICAREATGSGLYVQDIPDGKPRRIGDAYFDFSHPVSPDGKALVVTQGAKLVLLPAEGGSARPLPGFVNGDALIRWSGDGNALFIQRGVAPATTIFRLEVATGKRTLVRTLTPADPTGVEDIGPIQLTPDGETYSYATTRALSDLYIAEGLK